MQEQRIKSYIRVRPLNASEMTGKVIFCFVNIPLLSSGC
jgi:hypothetical protein